MTKHEKNLRKSVEKLLCEVDIYYCDFCGLFTDCVESHDDDECKRTLVKVTLADTMIEIGRDLPR